MRKKISKEYLDALRRAVDDLGSQSELARRSGVGQATISAILNPKNQDRMVLDSILDQLAPFCQKYMDEKHHPVQLAYTEADARRVPPVGAVDPFLSLVLESWGHLTFEQRGRVAGMVRDFGERNTPPPPSPPPPTAGVENSRPVLVCPNCRGIIPDYPAPGEKFSCPKCGQHIVIEG